jgi:regulator of replication initiation timing
MPLSMKMSSDCTSASPVHAKSMAISNITTPSLSSGVYFENTPLSSAVNLSLSVASSSSISSHEKEARTSQSPEYMLYSSDDDNDSPLSPETESVFNRSKEKRGFQHVTSQAFHQDQGYEKSMLCQYNYRHRASIIDYAATPNTHDGAFTKHYQGSEFTKTPSIPVTYPLSQHERRQRNKVASAKYRAKKNQQHGDMRSLISSLTKENELLKRQLSHVKRENNRLKGNCDRLRGKLVAEKMLKKFLCQKKHPSDDPLGGATLKVENASDASMILKDDVLIEQKHE